MFGVAGMIVGVPIFAVIYAAIKAVVNRSLRKKELPLDTNLYFDVDYVDTHGQFQQIEEEQKHLQKHKKHFLKKEDTVVLSDASSPKHNTTKCDTIVNTDDTKSIKK